jgi:DNA replication and repair protein RecF
MRLTHLALTNFRNYTRLDLSLPAGAVLLHGANAQGKTTLLEAVYYLATSKSPHASNDRQLLNWYANGPESLATVGRLTATVQTSDNARPRQIEIRLIYEQSRRSTRAAPNSVFRRQVLVNGVKVRLMDLLGNLNVVLFLPEDVTLVSEPPAERRRYMDITLCQVDRRYCRTLAQYKKVLSQRNALLKALQEGHAAADLAQLAPWDLKLTELGAVVMLRRAALITDLDRRAGQIYFQDLTGETESLRLIYHPRLQPDADDAVAWLLERSAQQVAEKLHGLLQAGRKAELQRGITLTGPHRDDVHFVVNGRDLGDYGSRGQQRTAVLALKLAEVDWMHAQTGERPVLLLDEVLAELDPSRRAYLLRRISAAEQAILTATDPAMFTDEFLSRATRFEVDQGRIAPHAG